jgi:DNA polymerase I-like protein with 3'-5' exonuclease and polymerase domains
MQIVTLDFETYYSSTFTLKKLNYAEYVASPEFEVIGFSLRINEGTADWYTGSREYLTAVLASIKWDRTLQLAHNNAFDAYILVNYFGFKPAGYLDTLSMARPLHGTNVGNSLGKLAEYYGLKAKGNEVVNAMGKHRRDFTKAELDAYGVYCVDDNDICFELFKIFSKTTSPTELKVISATIKITVEPVLVLDTDKLRAALEALRLKKESVLAGLGVDREKLMSNDKFAQVLMSLGIEPPTKLSEKKSATANKPVYTWAFSKTDPGMVELLEHEDETIQILAGARVEVKSTMAEGRMERLIKIGEIGALPFPLRYAGAHTNRWSGDWKINLQNLPKHKDVKRGIREPLRDAVLAPPGHKIVAFDSAQIEARVCAWLAGQSDLVELFAQGGDPYCEFATVAYGREITKADVIERFVGKGCIAEGQLVLTDAGLVPIEEVKTWHRVWDGVEWVEHEGVIFQGVRDVIEYDSLVATPDHIVYLESGSSCAFEVAKYDESSIAYTGFCEENIEVHKGFDSAPHVQVTRTVRAEPTGVKKRVWDIVNAGPRHRFTASGRLVANCVLGLGFGMGGPKLKVSLKKPIGGVSVDIELEEAERLKTVYREKNSMIVQFWSACHKAITAMYEGRSIEFGIGAKIITGPGYLILPSGNKLYYHGLEYSEGSMGRQYSYIDREGKKRKRVYKGLLCENIVQSVARDIICWQMLQAIKAGYNFVGTVHDELIFVVPDNRVSIAMVEIEAIMKSTPAWAAGCPISCEGAYAQSYGEC